MFSRVTRPLAAALAFSFLTVPALASAEEGRKRDEVFPVAGDVFVQRVDKRLDKTEKRVEKALEKKRVAPEKRKEVLAAVHNGTAQVRAAAQRAASDGTVTKEEAMEVRAVGKDVMQAIQEKFGLKWKKAPAGEREESPRKKKGRKASSPAAS